MTSFVNSSAQFKENLRTMELLSNRNNDPILNVNPIFFGSEKEPKPIIKDGFSLMKEQEHLWREAGKHKFVKDMIYHSDFDHPLSFHNEALYQGKPPLTVQYPSNLEENRK